MNKSAKVNKTTKSALGNTPAHSVGSSSLSQVKNIGTGHYITRDFAAGIFINTGDKPAEGIRVVTRFKSASNPSISKEIATLAEKAVLAVRNNTVKKK